MHEHIELNCIVIILETEKQAGADLDEVLTHHSWLINPEKIYPNS
jgi:hypothetical protein